MVQRRVRRRGRRGAGTLEQLANGRWRLKVSHDGRKVTYGTYATEDEAATAQARWRLTGLLPADDPQVELPASVAVGGGAATSGSSAGRRPSGRGALSCGPDAGAVAPSRLRRGTGRSGGPGGRVKSGTGCRTRCDARI